MTMYKLSPLDIASLENARDVLQQEGFAALTTPQRIEIALQRINMVLDNNKTRE